MGRQKHIKNTRCSKRVQVTFSTDQWLLIEKFRGILGNDDAEIVRNIVLAWLAEKSVIAEFIKSKILRGEKSNGKA